MKGTSIYQCVAAWILTRPAGATLHDVAEHFNLDNQEAFQVMSGIRKRKMFVTEWSPGVPGYHTPNRAPGVLKVLAINERRWNGTRHGPIVAVPTNPVLKPMHFRSPYEAEWVGGFLNVAVYKCLKHPHLTHGGCHWMTLEQYNTTLEKARLETELAFSC